MQRAYIMTYETEQGGHCVGSWTRTSPTEIGNEIPYQFFLPNFYNESTELNRPVP